MKQELMIKNKIIKGDKVMILLGKDRGKNGEILKVDTKKGRVLVEGINSVKRHIRKTAEYEGGVITLFKPVDISNVVLVCPNCNKPTRVGYKIEGEQKLRVCKKCGKEILGKKAKK